MDEDTASTEIPYEQLENSSDRLCDKPRRRLAVFSCFDFALIFLLWVLLVVTQSTDWQKEFINQINFADLLFFYHSLFDVVIISAVRLIALTISYACFMLKHWMPVALTMILTMIYLTVKGILYFTARHAGLPLEIALIVCSVVLSFFEVYLYDPNPKSPNDFNSGSQYGESEQEEEIGNSHVSTLGTISEIKNPEECIARAKEVLRYRWLWSIHLPKWNKVSSVPLILSHYDDKYGKVFYLRHEFPVRLEILYSVLYENTEVCPKWHKDVLEYKVLCKLSDTVDVTYSVSAPSMRGYVGSREFYDVRIVEENKDGGYTVGSISINPFVPSRKTSYIRGESGPNVAVFTPIDEHRSLFEWFFNTNLKGSLPRSLVDRSLANFLINFVKNLEGHLQSL
ncbi:MENTAL and START domain containing protein [Trichuris trichiura]|uniref:MENTAL and START domain containing protein n=1 Tax=Trichuris trichiura TaxID=36087 RepID=A0A077ZDD1_TRITR|nr:MENTAL and START domain containing protein [Trichuris trichiura]